MTQSDPFVTPIISSTKLLRHIMTTSSSIMGIDIKVEHLLAHVSAMMSEELRRHCNNFCIFFQLFLCAVFLQVPVQPSTECTRTGTLNFDPFFIFDSIYHKTQSQTNCHPYVKCHICLRQPLPPSIILLSTCALTPSVHYFLVINLRCDKAVPHPYP